MKRARIKAMVTVPMRRKATQDASIPDVASLTEHNEESKNTPNDSCAKIEQVSETTLQDLQIKENIEAVQVQSKQINVEDQHNECKDDSIQTPEQSRKETIQQQEVPNITENHNTSPIKVTQNRLGFMRPMPKFDNSGRVRRNSVQGSGASASESEDDNKKAITTNSNHIRNDSAQSVQSSKDTSVNNVKNNVVTSKVGQKRRIPVSESARKLAEARREFHLKHENKTPDRSKLTMYDLIYYNPVTNPMKKAKESAQIVKKGLESQTEEFQEEETEDDPSSAMPVPQVKVGPDGQLIIDEQSLIIEQTNVKKNREVLAKEAIIDDDNNGSGFYKKRQKSKEWSKCETLKFYTALNTVGTDFLLMQTLFPNRTRQEIKLKFKKEERVNRELVEKALAYHQEFDTETLEKSLATFESTEKQHSIIEEKQKQRAKDKRNLKPNKKRKTRIVASSIAEMDASDSEEEYGLDLTEHRETSEECQQTLNKSNKKICKRSRDEKSLTEKSIIETDDIESLSSCNGFDSDTEVYRVRPTRSGRLPKVKKLQGPDVNTLEHDSLKYCLKDYEVTMSPENNAEATENLLFDDSNVHSENHHTNSIKTVIPNIGDVEPGSLVILSKESLEEPGKSVLQVYMVSSDANSQDLEKSNITPVSISPELLATVTAKLSDVESVPVKEDE